MSKYTARYFINKFETIRNDRWVILSWFDGTGSCALGHCGVRITADILKLKEAKALFDLFEKNNLSITAVNDGFYQTNEPHFLKSPVSKQFGDTPKERVLNALYLIDSGILKDIE